MAGVIYGFCFFRAHHFTHLSLIFNPWIPLVVLAYEKLVTSFRWRRWAMLLVLAVLQCLTNWYTAFFVVLILGWRVLFDLVSKRLPKERIPALMGLMICAAALILPFYLPYLEHQGAPGALDEVRYNSANLGSYLQPPFNTFLGQWLGTERRWIWGERSTYAGYVALVLAVAGFYVLIRRRWNGDKRYLFLTYFSLGLFAFFVSLGPYFLDLGGFVSPVRLLYWVVPAASGLKSRCPIGCRRHVLSGDAGSAGHVAV
ncbi:YfhO family protein [Acidobacteria bacterium AH-259-O06]|nr:YfhO family protein [Acidobacteria bacterium AH-259-O06]